MKIRNIENLNGHIIVIRSKKNSVNNFSIFLAKPEFGQLKTLKETIELSSKLISERLPDWDMESYSVSDLREIEYEVENVNKERIVSFTLEDFLSEKGELLYSRLSSVLLRMSNSVEGALPSIRTGGVASGFDFFNRNKEIIQVWDTLDKRSDCILRAPRRFGKTSLAIHLTNNPKDNWRACYIDLEGENCPEEFVFSILKTMTNKPECIECLSDELVEKVLPNRLLADKQKFYDQEWNKIQEDWIAYADNFFNSINLENGPLLIILDEFSFLAENILNNPNSRKDGLDKLLDWFGTIRKKRSKEIFFIVSGSEHLPSFLDSVGIENNLSDLVTIHLDTFDLETTRAFIFLTMTKQNISISQEECDYILELMGAPIPYFLQLFLDILVKKCREGKDISKSSIESIYRHELLGTESKRHFESIKRQLNHYDIIDSNYSSAAKEIIELLAINKSVEKKILENEWVHITNKAGSFQSMYEIMRDDFYLEEQNEHVKMVSKILKDWWGVHMLRHNLTIKE